jgi:hypothetical protein
VKRLIEFVLASILVATVAFSQEAGGRERLNLAIDFDLEGKAASATLIVATVDIADSGSYTIAAQPDMARPLVLTITDADSSISAGTATIVGTDSNGATVTGTATLTGGSGTKTITWSPTTFTGNVKTVTTLTNGVLTGETAGTDKIALGTTSTLPFTYCLYRGYDGYPFSPGRRGPGLITTNGSSTTVTGLVAADDVYANVAVGDLLTFRIGGTVYDTRYVSARASADSITISGAAVTISADATTGTSFTYLRPLCGAEGDNGWIEVDQFTSVNFQVKIDQASGTGGIIHQLECRNAPNAVNTIELGPTTESSFPVSKTLNTIKPYSHCRVGLKWATNDDATDTTTAQEKITLTFEGRR